MGLQNLQLGGTPDEQALVRTLSTISELGLAENLIELEVQGFTVLRSVLSDDEINGARGAILDRVEKSTGKRPHVEAATAEDYTGMTYVPYLLYDDVLFEQILMQERPLALVTYLLGESCKLSSIGCHFKGPASELGLAAGPISGDGAIVLHADGCEGMVPRPTHSMIANVNYALVPYSKERGATAVVPGSHKLCRQPTPAEAQLHGEGANPRAIALDLDPGDCVVWHGNLWHGSYARQVAGLRMNLAVYFARSALAPQELHGEHVPREVLERQAENERFLRLLGQYSFSGWRLEGPQAKGMKYPVTGLYD